MDGYSVNEAAAVLGIPEGRVWELLARGVLSGSTEVGGDMRVFLRETAVTEAPKRDGNGHANGGNGGNGGGEITPFRELLTEFRNLTERYGQALLALGEARGEVASLRGRVDLLEARLDHRLPWSEAPTAWTPAPEPPADAAADVAESVPESEVSSVSNLVPPEPPAPESDPEPVPEARAEASEYEDEDFVADILGATLGAPPESTLPESTPPEESEPPRPRPAHRASPREALAGFAEALERAQDPATADVAADINELPGSEETAEAIAAYRREAETDAETDAGERPEPLVEQAEELEPVAEIEPIVEPASTSDEAAAGLPAASIVRPGYNTDTPEPDWIAEEDLIISAGEDASVRADELAHPVAVADVPEPDDAWPEVSKTEAATAAKPEVVEAAVVEAAVVDPEPPAAATDEPVPASAESRLAPVEIAAEPPASDDAALLVGPEPFSEPPIVPREPAFWESTSGRAPFAIAQPDPWEASPVATMPIGVRSPVPAAPAVAPTETSTEASAATPAPAPASRAEPAPTEPAPTTVEPEAAPASPPLSPAAQAGRAAAARRRPPRGPAARAIRRLRLMLD